MQAVASWLSGPVGGRKRGGHWDRNVVATGSEQGSDITSRLDEKWEGLLADHWGRETRREIDATKEKPRERQWRERGIVAA